MQSSMAYSSATRIGGFEVGSVAPICTIATFEPLVSFASTLPMMFRLGMKTVRVLVVLVRADAVEATLRGIEQLVDRPIIILTHAPRVGEFPPRRRDPHRLVAVSKSGGNSRCGIRWNILIFTLFLPSIRPTQGIRPPSGRASERRDPCSGLDVAIRRLALVTFRRRRTPIRQRSCVLGNQPVQEVLHLSHCSQMWASVAVWRAPAAR